ncbi:MAG: glycoside hydrolase family 99-like domain-containing protein, partial [Nanoarchaeota archaeon]|nr:glycoside hydrolase family 99-like domain-containing protein [Nanoarchaeota archaeon]
MNFVFNDPRYYKINNKPVLSINEPRSFDASIFIDIFNKLAIENGFGGILLISPFTHTYLEQRNLFDYLIGYPPGDISFPFQKRIIHKLKDILH